MGARAKEQIESVQKQGLHGKGIRIVAVKSSAGSPNLNIYTDLVILAFWGVIPLDK